MHHIDTCCNYIELSTTSYAAGLAAQPCSDRSRCSMQRITVQAAAVEAAWHRTAPCHQIGVELLRTGSCMASACHGSISCMQPCRSNATARRKHEVPAPDSADAGKPKHVAYNSPTKPIAHGKLKIAGLCSSEPAASLQTVARSIARTKRDLTVATTAEGCHRTGLHRTQRGSVTGCPRRRAAAHRRCDVPSHQGPPGPLRQKSNRYPRCS